MDKRRSLVQTALSAKAVQGLEIMGANLKRARIRRGIKQHELATRAGMSRPTLRKLEAGNPAVSIGMLAQLLETLGLEDHLALLADPDRDELGKALEETKRPSRVDSKRHTSDFDF